jgi:hypothetical protein
LAWPQQSDTVESRQAIFDKLHGFADQHPC